jgi:hypothetical protein
MKRKIFIGLLVVIFIIIGVYINVGSINKHFLKHIMR